VCGRFILTCDTLFENRFSIMGGDAACVTRYNIAPSQMVPIIVRESPNKAVLMRWGLVPFWAKDMKIGNRMINARAETAPTSPAFRTAWRRQRCLVPTTGFYEWKDGGGRKTPYLVRMKDRSYLAMAGLYDRWESPEGEEVKSFTILTTSPNKLVGAIHDRMPVVLRTKDEEVWLADGTLSRELYKKLIRPHPSRGMEAYRVSTLVNSRPTISRRSSTRCRIRPRDQAAVS
jgi:putative SOS response-associated peptidase YedK